MAREDPQLKLRLTEEMKERVAESARENGRSVNAEIVARIEAAEGIRRLLDDFELLKGQYVSQQGREKALTEQVANMHRIAAGAQDINRQLIELLMRRLNVSEDEIIAITRPTGGE